MRYFGLILLIGLTLFFTPATFAHTLPRERRQSNPAVMPLNGRGIDDRAAIPGLSEIQTAIDIAQFLINVGQQVLPAILQSLIPPSNEPGNNRMLDEMHLIEALRQRITVGNQRMN